MPSRTELLLASVIVSAAVAIAPQTITAQARGMGGASRGMHGGIRIRGAHHARLTRGEHRKSYGGCLFYPGFDYFSDDSDRNYEAARGQPQRGYGVAKRAGRRFD
jgi:hypothetical protein